MEQIHTTPIPKRLQHKESSWYAQVSMKSSCDNTLRGQKTATPQYKQQTNKKSHPHVPATQRNLMAYPRFQTKLMRRCTPRSKGQKYKCSSRMGSISSTNDKKAIKEHQRQKRSTRTLAIIDKMLVNLSLSTATPMHKWLCCVLRPFARHHFLVPFTPQVSPPSGGWRGFCDTSTRWRLRPHENKALGVLVVSSDNHRCDIPVNLWNK